MYTVYVRLMAIARPPRPYPQLFNIEKIRNTGDKANFRL